MPITPFHWGPSSWVGLLLFRVLDFSTFLIASVIIDIEPFYIVFFNLGYPFHRFFHTFLGGSIAAIVIAIILYLLRAQIKKIMAIFKLAQDSSFKKILWTSFAGVYFHVFLDSFVNSDMKPFYPFEANPLLGVFSPLQIYLFCGISFFAGILLYLVRLTRKNLPE